MAGKTDKQTPVVKTNTGVGAAKKPAFDLNQAIAAAKAAGSGQASGSTLPYRFTQQEGSATVTDTYQQLLGRDATPAEYNQGLKIVMAQDPYTSGSARAQLIESAIQASPEYQARSQNKWLNAIYADLQNQMARAKQ